MDTDNHEPIEPIPDFDSYAELGEFWDSHSLADYWDQTEVAQLVFGPGAMTKPTLFGSIRAGDVTDEMIEESKRDLFRDLDDL